MSQPSSLQLSASAATQALLLASSSAPFNAVSLSVDAGSLRVRALGLVHPRQPFVTLTRQSSAQPAGTPTAIVPVHYHAERDVSVGSGRVTLDLRVDDLGDRPVYVVRQRGAPESERIVEVSPQRLLLALRDRFGASLRLPSPESKDTDHNKDIDPALMTPEAARAAVAALYGFTQPTVAAHLLALLNQEYDALLLPPSLAADGTMQRLKRTRGLRARAGDVDERAVKRQRRMDDALVGIGRGVRDWTPGVGSSQQSAPAPQPSAPQPSAPQHPATQRSHTAHVASASTSKPRNRRDRERDGQFEMVVDDDNEEEQEERSDEEESDEGERFDMRESAAYNIGVIHDVLMYAHAHAAKR